MCCNEAPPPPDYTPVANASAEATAMGDRLARDQMAEGRRQYDAAMEVARPVVDAQLQVMRQGLAQGDDYYNYMKEKQRPIEDALQTEALRDTSGLDAADRAAIIAARTGLAGTVGDVAAQRQATGERLAGDLQAGLGDVSGRLSADGRTMIGQAGRQMGAALGGGLRDTRADLRRLDAASSAGLGEYRAGTRENLGQFDAATGAGLGEYRAGTRENLGQFDTATGAGLGEYRAGTRENLGQFDTATGAGLARFGDRADGALAGAYKAYENAMGASDASLSRAEADMMAAAGRAGGGGGISSTAGRHAGQISSDIGLFTSGNDAIRSKYGTDIENDAALALADARAGQAQSTGAAIRQAMRYGLDPSTIASGAALQNAQMQAAAANNTRTASTDKYRGIVGQGIGLRQNLMNSDVQAAIGAANADNAAAQIGVGAAGDRMRLALQRAGLATDASARLADMNIGVGDRLAGMELDTAGRRAGMAMDASGRQVGLALDAAGQRAGMAMDASGRQAGLALDAAGRRAGLGVDAAGRFAALGSDNARLIAGMGLDLAGRTAGLDAGAIGTATAMRGDAADAGYQGRLQAADINAGTATMGRDLRIADDARNVAKKMDVAGMYRGMPGASAGAYGLAANAGSSANANNMAPGASYMSALGGANNTAMGGRQIAMNGLTSVLGAQTSYANANQGESLGSILGGIGGAALGLSKLSDIRLKADIEPVDRDKRTGLRIYEFSYVDQPERRFRGVMAHEVEEVDPAAVVRDERGIAKVNYGRLGLEMTEA